MVTVNSSFMKSVNRKRVLEVLRQRKEGLTKQELAQETQLTVASIGNIVHELEQLNLIKAAGYAESSGGRKPIIYQMNPDAYYVIGFSIGVGRTHLIITNLDGDILFHHFAVFDQAQPPHDVLRDIVRQVDHLVKQAQVDYDRIIGIGISAPGPLDPHRGVMLSPPNLPQWKAVEVGPFFEKELNIPAFLEKDANAAALCERWYGAGKEYENLLYVMVDAGIGSGIVVGGSIYRGKSNVAGEIGHGTIDIDGPRCNCGNYGCLEVMASGQAIVRRAKEEIRRGFPSSLVAHEEELTLSHILQAYQQGDQLSHYLLQESSRYVGIALADKINFLNPELVVLGGDIPQAVEPYFEWVQNVAMQRIFQETAMGVKFARSRYGTLSEALGATTRVMESMFGVPKFV